MEERYRLMSFSDYENHKQAPGDLAWPPEHITLFLA